MKCLPPQAAGIAASLYLCACGAPPLSVAVSPDAGDELGAVVVTPEASADVGDAGDAGSFVDELAAPAPDSPAPFVVDARSVDAAADVEARPVDAGTEAACEAGRVGWIYNDFASGLVYSPSHVCDPCDLTCACLLTDRCTYVQAGSPNTYAPPKTCTQTGSTFLLCCEHPGSPDLGCAPRDQ